MLRATMYRRLAIFAAAVLASWAEAATRAPAVPVLANSYEIEIATLKVGSASLTAAVEANDYRADVTVATEGLVRLFAQEDWAAETVGRASGWGLTPIRYRSFDNEREILIEFDAGVPEEVRAEPELTEKPWSLDPRAQRGVTDPVTALLSILAPVQAERACGQRIEAFDGRRRFAFVLYEAGPDGPGVRCSGALVYLAGYKPEKIGRKRPFSVEYSDVAGGLVQITRITLPTALGNVVMRLRS